jgi:hypothetical protein
MLKAMKHAILWRTALLTAAFSAVLPAWADSQFHIRKMTRDDVPAGKGQCDIVLQVDREVEATIRGDMVSLHNISGRDARDQGSECNAPLPDRDLEGFNFLPLDNGDAVRLVEEPSRRNGYRTVVRLRGNGGGSRYHFRLEWRMTLASQFSDRDHGDFPGRRRDDDFRDGDGRRGGAGFSWNNAVHSEGRGHGSSTLAGHGAQRLSGASVDIDRAGHISASFRTDNGRNFIVNGSVIGSDNGTLKADVVTDDRFRLPGSLYLSRDPRGDVYRMTLDATNGQDRLHLEWERDRR